MIKHIPYTNNRLSFIWFSSHVLLLWWYSNSYICLSVLLHLYTFYRVQSSIPTFLPGSSDKVGTRLIAGSVATRAREECGRGIQMCPWSGYCLSGMSLITRGILVTRKLGYSIHQDNGTYGDTWGHHHMSHGHMASETERGHSDNLDLNSTRCCC